MEDSFRSGYVSITGRPNVGKSTLLNALLGQKIAIVTDRPQTTRNRLLGIKTLPDAQIIFIDTPGIHQPRHLLGRKMVHTAKEVLQEIDVVIFMTDSYKALGQDREILSSFANIEVPVFLLINKIDVMPKAELPRIIGEYSGIRPFAEIIPVSAEKGTHLDLLLDTIKKYLPSGPKYYPDDLVTDQIERFMATEIIREKIMLKTSDEIPYSVAVEVLEWKERQNGVVAISANIYVEREGQKGIIIGDKGKLLKMIGTNARIEIEKLLGTKVFLELWVKVRSGWRDDKRALHELGYN
ncbi:MAG: GTPase Era [Nitrospirae bacterium]|nr:MAG: GTPase Era [Nitrospirota bacterium]